MAYVSEKTDPLKERFWKGTSVRLISSLRNAINLLSKSQQDDGSWRYQRLTGEFWYEKSSFTWDQENFSFCYQHVLCDERY